MKSKNAEVEAQLERERKEREAKERHEKREAVAGLMAVGLMAGRGTQQVNPDVVAKNSFLIADAFIAHSKRLEAEAKG